MTLKRKPVHPAKPASQVTLAGPGGTRIKPAHMGEAFTRLRNYDWRAALRLGLDMAAEDARDVTQITDEDIMWALLCEAVQTSAICDSAPPRSGYPQKSQMPDSPDEVTPWQMMSAYLRGDLDQLPEERQKAPTPSAAQITRKDMVLDVWHLVALDGVGNWRVLRRALVMKAGGIPARVVHAKTGVNRQQFYRAKQRAMRDMWDFIKGC